jgi:ATP-dependent Clp protease ATP-binding subunit ClpA
MDRAAVDRVLLVVRDGLARQRGIVVNDEALREIVALAGQYLPNRAFPDEGDDLIEQSVSYALTHGRTTVDVATAREAVAALLGMPDRSGPRLRPRDRLGR